MAEAVSPHGISAFAVPRGSRTPRRPGRINARPPFPPVHPSIMSPPLPSCRPSQADKKASQAALDAPKRKGDIVYHPVTLERWLAPSSFSRRSRNAAMRNCIPGKYCSVVVDMDSDGFVWIADGEDGFVHWPLRKMRVHFTELLNAEVSGVSTDHELQKFKSKTRKKWYSKVARESGYTWEREGFRRAAGSCPEAQVEAEVSRRMQLVFGAAAAAAPATAGGARRGGGTGGTGTIVVRRAA